MSTVNDKFILDLRKVIARSKANARDVCVAVVLDLERRFKQATPVDKGVLRNRWAIGLNAPDDFAYVNPDPSGIPSRLRNVAVMTRFVVGQSVYVTNNMPYLPMIEYGLYGKPPGSANGPKTKNGFSIQAEAGFIRLTYDIFLRSINRTAKAAIK